MGMHPSGPGAFRVTAMHSSSPPPKAGSDYIPSGPWSVFEADARTQTVTAVIVSGEDEANVMYVPATGETLQAENDFMIAAWPTGSDHALVLKRGGGTTLGSLIRLPLRNGADPTQTWELLSFEDPTRVATAFRTGIDDDGTERAFILVYEDTGDWSRTIFYSWRPTLDFERVGSATAGVPTMVSASDGGAVLSIETNSEWEASEWRISGREVNLTGQFNGRDSRFPSAKALIDPTNATFAVTEYLGGYDRRAIGIYHRGNRVWSIDTLQFGLERRAVDIHDLVLLEAPN